MAFVQRIKVCQNGDRGVNAVQVSAIHYLPRFLSVHHFVTVASDIFCIFWKYSGSISTCGTSTKLGMSHVASLGLLTLATDWCCFFLQMFETIPWITIVILSRKKCAI